MSEFAKKKRQKGISKQKKNCFVYGDLLHVILLAVGYDGHSQMLMRQHGVVLLCKRLQATKSNNVLAELMVQIAAIDLYLPSQPIYKITKFHVK